MRICMLAYAFYESDNRIRRYAETLVRRGDEVDAIVIRRHGQPKYREIDGVHVYGIQERERNERGSLSYLLKLLAFFFRSIWHVTGHHVRDRYDVIHVHSVPDFEVLATIIPWIMGSKVILDIHDIVPEFYASKFNVKQTSFVIRLLLWVEKISARFSHHVIIANHLWHTKLTERSVPENKCTPIINYPDLSIFYRRPRLRPTSEPFLMCYPGTLNWHQGVDLAIEAVGLLRDRAPNLKFLIIGDGPDRDKLQALVRQKNLGDRVTMTGLIPIEKVAEMLAEVDLGVVPKRSNGFGDEAFSTKIMEFMAMGVPVVTGNTRIDQYYFSENVAQFFAAGNAEDLAAKIFDLMQNPAKRQGLRERASEFILSNSWDVRKHEYLQLVDSLAGQKASSEVASDRPGTINVHGRR